MRPLGRRLGAWSIAAALLTVNAGCAGYRPAPPPFDPGDVSRPSALQGTPLTLLWRSRPIRGPSAPLALDSLNAYVAGADRRIAAVDLLSGRTRWAVRVPGPVIGGVLQSGELVYAATDRPGGSVHALRRESGSQAWSSGVGYVVTPLALIGGHLIVFTRKGACLALDPATGKIRWRLRLGGVRLAAQDLGDGRMLVSAGDSLYTVSLRDGKVALRRRAPGMLASAWVRAGGLLVAATADSQVVAVEPDSLRPRWRVRVDAPLLASPATGRDTLYVATQVGSLFRVVPDSQGGADLLRLHEAGWPTTGAPALAGPWLLVGGADGVLRAFATVDGSEAWRLVLGRPVELAPVLLPDGSLLAFGGTGHLQRMRP